MRSLLRRRPRGFVPLLLLLALYVVARSVVAAYVPWRPAFDDFFYLPETRRWLAAGALGDDGVFRRVPLWNLLLGAHMALFGNAAIVVLQSWVAALVAALGTGAARRAASTESPLAHLPVFLLLLSPQLVLYSRQAVNELFIGMLLMGMIALGSRPTARRAFAMGALAGLAAMTKLVAAFSLVVAAGPLVSERGRLPLRLSLARLALGFGAVSLPLALFAMVSRGSLLLDNTSAYNLSGFTPAEWIALGDPVARYEQGMARFTQIVAEDPWAYLVEAAARVPRWLARPSSADFSLFYAGYPQPIVEGMDLFVSATLFLLAVVGTRRRELGVWIFLAIVVATCCVGRFTPASPKVMVLIPTAMLAPTGVERIRALLRRPHRGE